MDVKEKMLLVQKMLRDLNRDCQVSLQLTYCGSWYVLHNDDVPIYDNSSDSPEEALDHAIEELKRMPPLLSKAEADALLAAASARLLAARFGTKA